MADNGQIKHTDIAEVGVLKPLQDELIATIKIINTMDADLVSIAKSLKKALSDGTNTSTEAMKKLTEQAKLAKDAMSIKEIQTKQLAIAEAKLSANLTEEAQKLADVNLKLQEQNKEIKENAKLTSDQIGAYDKASIKLNQMTKAWKNLAIVQKENTVEGKALKTQIDELDATLKRVDAQTGKFNRNVGNYKSGFSGLGTSINQLTRELPAFTYSMQTGFMGISNNIPMLVDQLNLLKKANAELTANGEKAVPIWKQLGSAIFSWNTLISLAITATTVFGKEIGEFFKNLFKSTSQMDLLAESTKRLAEVQDKASASAVEENVKLTILLRTAKDVTLSMEDRKKAVDELQKTYPNYLGNLSQEEILAGKTAKAEFLLRDAILSKAKAQAATAQIVENETKRLELLKKQKEAEISYNDKLARQEQAINRLKGDKTGRDATAMMTQSAIQQANSARKELEGIRTEIQIIDKENKNLLDTIITVQPKVNSLINESSKINSVNEKQTKNNTKTKKEAIKVIEDEIEATRKLEYAQVGLVDAKRIHNEAEDKLFKFGKKRRQEEKDEAKKEADLMRSATNILENTAKKQLQITNNKIDREVQANQRRQQDLRELSLKGVQDANNNLAFEERKQAELEAKRMKAQKNAKKQEILFAGLKAYSANVERNPNTALMTTLKDLTLLTSALSSLPTFLEGTENIAKSLGKPQLKGKDGYIVRVDGDERVLNPEQNKKIGNLTNEELTNLAEKKNKGLIDMTKFISVPMSNAYNDNLLISETSRMNKNLEDMKVLLKNMPTQTIQYDELAKISTEIIRSEHRVISTSKKIGGLRG